MNFFTKLIVCSALLALAYGDHLAWKDCGGSLVKFNKVDISPLPINISSNSKIFLTSNVAVSEDLPVNAEIHVELAKNVSFWKHPLPVPCIDGVGSCTAKLSDLSNLFYGDVLCPLFKGNGHCDGSFKAGHFVNEHIEVKAPLNKLHIITSRGIGDGDFSFRFTISDHAKTHHFACLEMKAKLHFV